MITFCYCRVLNERKTCFLSRPSTRLGTSRHLVSSLTVHQVWILPPKLSVKTYIAQSCKLRLRKRGQRSPRDFFAVLFSRCMRSGLTVSRCLSRSWNVGTHLWMNSIKKVILFVLLCNQSQVLDLRLISGDWYTCRTLLVPPLGPRDGRSQIKDVISLHYGDNF